MDPDSLATLLDTYRNERRIAASAVATLREELARAESTLADVTALHDATQLLIDDLKQRESNAGQVRADIDVRGLSIVDAAIRIAQSSGVEEATSGDVLEWLLLAGFRTPSGRPTRNSVYVSLNRAAKKPTRPISLKTGGIFVFLPQMANHEIVD